MSKAQKVKDRLFGGKSVGSNNDGEPSGRPADPSLTIQIPKPPNAVTSSGPAPPKLNKPAPPPVEQEQRDERPYRERLLEKLGHKYNGVERYRLDQDDSKEKHWKRWGPYLSERQWVS
jgi:hypothetical protein